MKSKVEKANDTRQGRAAQAAALQKSSSNGLMQMADNREVSSSQAAHQMMIDYSPRMATQRQKIAQTFEAPLQRLEQPENKTGLPDHLKAGLEHLSGLSMDDVRVHYNSSKPAEIQAHAFTQGTDIHIAPGQEKHLPHEGWHVVQQVEQGVKPTHKVKGSMINDELVLENEAERMGQVASLSDSYMHTTKPRITRLDQNSNSRPVFSLVNTMTGTKQRKVKEINQPHWDYMRKEDDFLITTDMGDCWALVIQTDEPKYQILAHLPAGDPDQLQDGGIDAIKKLIKDSPNHRVTAYPGLVDEKGEYLYDLKKEKTRKAAATLNATYTLYPKKSVQVAISNLGVMALTWADKSEIRAALKKQGKLP